ncbi:MAG TPA: class I SAM-dependent methyltransferase [Noviherbaspirillum sp.]
MQALLIQFLSFPLVLVFGALLSAVADVQLTVAFAALLQGGIAAMIARLRNMATWWIFIQFLFPVALLLVSAIGLPSWIYLAAFLVLLCLYWTTFRTQVPYYPSTAPVWNAVDASLPQGRPLRIIDIGSGFGGLVLHLARSRPESEVMGIEAAPLPWLASLLRARLMRSPARFVRGDYGRLDFADHDVVFAYLSPAAMPTLWEKACAEMQPGSLLISFEFPIPGVEPDVIVRPTRGGPALYAWHIGS